MVFEHLGSVVSGKHVAHGYGPDSARNPPDDGVFRVKSVGEKKRQVRCKAVNIHPARQIILHIGKPVGKRKGQLGDGVCPGLCNMISRDGYGVKVADLFFDEVLLDVTHHFKRKIDGKYTGILPLILFENISLNRPADAS